MPRMSQDRTIVIGAGLAGLASAYYLRLVGHDVCVLDRNVDVGLGASFANGGMLTPSMSDPWNAPGVHRLLLQSLGRKDSPMCVDIAALPRYLGWGLKFLANSSVSKHRRAMEANFALAALSVVEIRRLRHEHRLDYSVGLKGTMKVFRDATSFASSKARSRELRDHGLQFEVLDAAGTIDIEPQLADIRDSLVGAIYYPADETGDAQAFCRELKRFLAQRGVSFRFGGEVRGIRVEQRRVRAVVTDSDEIDARRVVVAAGAWSPRVLSALNIRPVKGYSLSIEGVPSEQMLSVAIVDDALHAAATPLGSTLRLAGTAEFSGWNSTLDARRIEMLWNLLEALNPGLVAVVNRANAKPWCGFRPMAADGRPYICATHVAGLFVNAGHGHLGWTQAMGSGLLLSQLIDGKTPVIDPRPYALQR